MGNEPAVPHGLIRSIVRTQDAREPDVPRALSEVLDRLLASYPEGGDAPGYEKYVMDRVRDLIRAIGSGQSQAANAALDELVRSISELERESISNREGVEAQVAEFYEEIERLSAASLSGTDEEDEIAKELARRKRWSAIVRETQERLENDLDEVREEHGTLKQLIDLGGCDDERTAKASKAALERKIESDKGLIGTIIDFLAENDREVRILCDYRDALAKVREKRYKPFIGKKFKFLNNFESHDEKSPATE